MCFSAVHYIHGNLNFLCNLLDISKCPLLCTYKVRSTQPVAEIYMGTSQSSESTHLLHSYSTGTGTSRCCLGLQRSPVRQRSTRPCGSMSPGRRRSSVDGVEAGVEHPVCHAPHTHSHGSSLRVTTDSHGSSLQVTTNSNGSFLNMVIQFLVCVFKCLSSPFNFFKCVYLLCFYVQSIETFLCFIR